MTWEELSRYSVAGSDGAIVDKCAVMRGYSLGPAGAGGMFFFRFVDEQLGLITYLTPADLNSEQLDAVWTNGSYFYCVGQDSPNNRITISVYNVVNGKLVKMSGTSIVQLAANIPTVWGDSNYLYVTDNATIYAFRITGSGLEHITSVAAGAGFIYGMFTDDTYLYVAGVGGIEIYTFNGVAFTLVLNEATGIVERGIWTSGQYVFSCGTGANELRAYSFDGVALTQLATEAGGLDLWGDGEYVYCAQNLTGMTIFQFDGAAFETKTTVTGDDGQGVMSDDFYLYLSSSTELIIYKVVSEFRNSFGVIPTAGAAPLAVKFTNQVEIF